MAYTKLKESINKTIRRNGNQDITGPVLNMALTAIINTVGDGASFMGIANYASNPGKPDRDVFYLANGDKPFSNFGGFTPKRDGLHILMWNASSGSWGGETLVDFHEVEDYDNKVKVSVKAPLIGDGTSEKPIIIPTHSYEIKTDGDTIKGSGTSTSPVGLSKIYVDNDTVEGVGVQGKPISIRKVYTDEDTIRGTGTPKSPIEIKTIYTDGDTIVGKGTKDDPIGVSPHAFEKLLSYGVDFQGSRSEGVRIGNMDFHRDLPIHNKIRSCILKDNGEVNYWLDDNDSNKKEDGSKAVLDGTHGQVMVYLPCFWYKIEGSKYRIANIDLGGYTFSPACYVSKYEASLFRTELILSSVVNDSEAYRGGTNKSEWDTEPQSLLGKPATSISLTNFIKYASNRGEGWTCNSYDVHKKICILYIIEYANRNVQASFNQSLTSEGYKQGGLGQGVTTLSGANWNSFNQYNPFIPCGYTNSIGSNTGVKDFTMPSEYGDLVVGVPSYRGIENLFGHIWKWTEGAEIFVEPGEGNTRLEINGAYAGRLPRQGGYIKDMLEGEFMPSEVGGGSTINWCDYFYHPDIPEEEELVRALRLGGAADNGATAGLFCSSVNYSAATTTAYIGSRLCFLGK